MQSGKISRVWVLSLFRAYPNILKLSSFIILANLCMLLSPVIFSQIIDTLTASSSLRLVQNISLIVLMGVAITILNTLVSIYINKSTVLFQDNLRVKLWRNLNLINLENFEEQSIGEWQSKLLYDISVISSSTQIFISTFIPAFIVFFGGFFIIATKQAFILLIVLGVILLNVLIYIFFKEAIFRLAERYRKSMMKQNQFLLDVVQLIPIIRIFALKEKFSAKLEESLCETRADNISLNNKSIYLSCFISVSIEFVKILVLIISIYFCLKGELSVGEVVLYQVLLTQSLSTLNQVFSISSQIEIAKDSYISLMPFVDKGLKNSSKNQIKSSPKDEKNIIEFEALSFKYKNAENPIFEDLDFRMKRNTTVCIYGKIGSGKTSITKLISNLYLPTKGEIRVKLKEESSLPLAYVGQTVPVFQSSLFENIRLFDDNISKEKIIAMIESLKLDKFFSRFDNDLDTKILQSTLSGGQIQCIGILRALIRDPEILILDEITNNLDILSKLNIYKFISALKSRLSIVIISHDTDCYEFSDEVYLISNKKVINIASKKSLIEELSN